MNTNTTHTDPIDPNTGQVSQEICEQILELVRKQHGLTAEDKYGPVLVMDHWSGYGCPAIVWEEGPSYWPLYVVGGGRPECYWTLPAMEDEIPAGVFLEAGYAWSMNIYPA